MYAVSYTLLTIRTSDVVGPPAGNEWGWRDRIEPPKNGSFACSVIPGFSPDYPSTRGGEA
jgi:hypothetical protein